MCNYYNFPPANVDIDGPTTGNVNTSYTFTANVSPTTTTPRITYVWRATGQSETMTITSALSNVVSFDWHTTGSKIITVTATNAVDTVSDTYVITIDNQSPVADARPNWSTMVSKVVTLDADRRFVHSTERQYRRIANLYRIRYACCPDP
jgi:hypothetical protein